MFDGLQILGGLAVFLYGMNTLSSGMEKLAGSRIQVWLDRMTGNPLKGAALGAVATASVQSSSLIMVTMIGLINANIMTLPQAIGVMMGQEIGTTITAQIVAFKVGNLSFLLLPLGFILKEFNFRKKSKEYGEVIFGLGLLFLGMDLMSSALVVLTRQPVVTAWLTRMGQNLLLGILAGTLTTVVIQSSSAVTALVVAMGISQVINLPGAIAIIFGANIGTCFTGFMASFRLSRNARQASMAQILINIIGVLIFLPIIPLFTDLVRYTSDSLPRQIANAHSIFNILVSIILFPFIRQIARLTRYIVPDAPATTKQKVTTYIDPSQSAIPSVALAQAMRETLLMGTRTAEMLSSSADAAIRGDLAAAQFVADQEEGMIDPLRDLLEQYLIDLMHMGLSADQQQRCLQIKDFVHEIERVGDLCFNITRVAIRKNEQGITFSPQAISDLETYFAHTISIYQRSLACLETNGVSLVNEVCLLEDKSNDLYLEFCQNHIERTQSGICRPESDVLFIEILRDLERIADHADNLGVSLLRA